MYDVTTASLDDLTDVSDSSMHKDWNNHIRYVELVDGDIFYVYWDLPKDSEPDLKVVYTNSDHEVINECNGTEIRFPYSNQSEELNYCSWLIHRPEQIFVSLRPLSCHGDTACHLPHPRPPKWEEYRSWEIKEFFESAPALELIKDVHSYVLQWKMDPLYWNRFFYLDKEKCYKLEELKTDLNGAKIYGDWEVVYFGPHEYRTMKLKKPGIYHYRVSLANCFGHSLHEISDQLIWSQPSNRSSITITYGTELEIVTTTEDDKSLQNQVNLYRKLKLQKVFISLSSIVLLGVVVFISYFFCYKHCGVCRTFKDGIPKPKLLIQIVQTNEHEKTYPEDLESEVFIPVEKR